ncbi:MAG: hypothetical protein ACXWDO_05380 [Bacteroidia bacterium]
MTYNEGYAVKKCPNCGKFSHYDYSVEAKCEFCGAILDPRTFEAAKAKEEKEQQAQLKHEHPVFWVSIKPSDSSLTVLGKQVLRAAQIIYMAIISFLLWITAIVAG